MNMMLMNMMQVLTNITADPGSNCRGFDFLIRIIKNGLFPILQIGIPIILIVLGTLDLGKAVISSDDKAVKEAQSKLIKRCIYAILVFFIVTLLNLLFSMIGQITGNEALTQWSNCWNYPAEIS